MSKTLSAAQQALLSKLAERDRPYDADIGQEPRVAVALESRGLVKIERVVGYYDQRRWNGNTDRIKTVSLLVTLTPAGRAVLA